jgi:hypothetical protein
MENKRNVVIVYQTDMWNTRASRSMRGIYPNLSTAMDAIVKNNKIKDGDTSEQSIRQELLQYGQTQRLNINYDIEEVTIGEWIE